MRSYTFSPPTYWTKVPYQDRSSARCADPPPPLYWWAKINGKKRRRLKLYITNENPTELYYERQELLREARDAHLARQLRVVRSKGSPRSERRMASLGRAIALWGRTSVPFFRA